MNKYSVVLIVFLVLLSQIAWSAETVIEEGDVTIFFGNLLAGTSHYRIVRDGPDFADTKIVTDTNTHTLIKSKGRTDFSQQLEAVIDGKTGELKSYHIKNESPFKTEDTLIQFGERSARVVRKTEGTTVENALTYSKKPCVVDMQNPAGGNWNLPLLQSILQKEDLRKKERLELEGLYTGVFQISPVIFEKVEEKLTGSDPYLLYNMRMGKEEPRLTLKIYLSPESGKIKKVESPSENFTYKMEGGRKVATPPEVFKAFSIPQPKSIENCGLVKAQVRLRLLEENIRTESLSTASQKFEGSFKDGILEGSVDVRSSSLKTLDSPAYPCQFGGEVPKECLEPEFLVESEDKDIRITAEGIVKDSKTLKEAVRRLGEWIYGSIGFQFNDGSAKATLLAKKGDWLPRIRLFIAMCRSLSIPARYACGFLINENMAGNYIWAEVYMGKAAGWVPIDVALGHIEYFSANHITLWHYGFFDPYTCTPELKVTEYTEEPRPKGSKFIVR